MTTIEDLRRFAVVRSLFPPTTLMRVVERLGFVQADPDWLPEARKRKYNWDRKSLVFVKKLP